MADPPSGRAQGAGSAVYAFTGDFVDAGIDTVADDLVAKGFSAVALATVYHAARDLLPHNPRHVVAHRDEGAFYFAPDRSAYAGELRPPDHSDGQARDFALVTSALAARGLAWQAWTVYLHNSRLASAHPELGVTNAFGDAYITDLCPSSDAAAAYACSLTADVARLRPSLIVAESLHHAGFGHGYHHERSFVDVSQATAFLLSLCFCASCVARAEAEGVDARGLAARVRAVVRDSLDGGGVAEASWSRETLEALCGSSLLAYLRTREQTVTSLAARCAEIARAAGTPFGFLDQTGALKGYATGAPTGAACADDAWQLGIAPADIARRVDSYVSLAYAKDPARVARDVAAYARDVADDAELRCVLRHGGPDYEGPANLREKAESAIAQGASAIDFYHYGMMPLPGLDAAAAAVGGASSRRKES